MSSCGVSKDCGVGTDHNTMEFLNSNFVVFCGGASHDPPSFCNRMLHLPVLTPVRSNIFCCENNVNAVDGCLLALSNVWCNPQSND